MGAVRTRIEDSDVRIPRQDPKLIYRIVGFLEYGESLKRLDRFVKTSSPEEISIANAIVQEEDQFIVYTNLSQHFEGEASKRHGLDWMIALAKVELGAMLAGFTSHRNPFRAVSPTHYESDAYGNILIDGFQTHFRSLAKDPAVQNYRNAGLPGKPLDSLSPQNQNCSTVCNNSPRHSDSP